MNISILGAGSWGTANAVLLANARHSVTVWGRSAEDVDEIRRTGMNAKYLPGERLSAAITWTADPASAVKDADIVVIAVPSRHFEEVCRAFSPHVPAGATVVSLAKGFCPKTHRRMSGRQRGQSPRATMRRTFIRLAVLFVALFAARPSASAAINPCELSFVRLASRRFVLDNEL
ncbi:MAG: 2-dehydropantoate 2-reductase N-terminal domain-containing protein, partial [Kiritimatiellia bacterium]